MNQDTNADISEEEIEIEDIEIEDIEIEDSSSSSLSVDHSIQKASIEIVYATTADGTEPIGCPIPSNTNTTTIIDTTLDPQKQKTKDAVPAISIDKYFSFSYLSMKQLSFRKWFIYTVFVLCVNIFIFLSGIIASDQLAFWWIILYVSIACVIFPFAAFVTPKNDNDVKCVVFGTMCYSPAWVFFLYLQPFSPKLTLLAVLTLCIVLSLGPISEWLIWDDETTCLRLQTVNNMEIKGINCCKKIHIMGYEEKKPMLESQYGHNDIKEVKYKYLFGNKCSFAKVKQVFSGTLSGFDVHTDVAVAMKLIIGSYDNVHVIDVNAKEFWFGLIIASNTFLESYLWLTTFGLWIGRTTKKSLCYKFIATFIGCGCVAILTMWTIIESKEINYVGILSVIFSVLNVSFLGFRVYAFKEQQKMFSSSYRLQ